MKKGKAVRITAMAMAVTMAAMLVGCGSTESTETATTVTTTEAAATETVAAEEVKVFPATYGYDLILPVSDETLVDEKVNALVKSMTIEEKYTFLGGSGTGTEGNAGDLPGVGCLGVPRIKMYDGPAGVLYPEDTTNMPGEELLAATWNEEMAKLYGQTVGEENTAIGGTLLLGAQLDIQRNPQFGRTKDQMGEDSYLLASLADDLVSGMQKSGSIAVLKHYTALTQNATPAAKYDDIISEQALHETYLPGFESAVKDGNALGIMSSYNAINGEWAAESEYLLEDVLRGMWGYNYFTITDWGGNSHSGFTMNKGTEIEMPTLSNNSQEGGMAEVEAGNITEDELNAIVDNALSRVLRAYGAAGYLTLVEVDADGYAVEGTVEGGADYINTVTADESKARLEALYNDSNAAIETIAEEGIVLLKNENDVLPLDTSDDKTVAVIGITGLNIASGIGGERSYGAVKAMTSPYEALVSILGENKVQGEVYSDIIGTTIPKENLFTSADGDEKGVTRTYGCLGTNADSDLVQGQFQFGGGLEETAMGDHEIGEFAQIDEVIEFVTNGKGNYTNEVAGGNAIESLVDGVAPAYTWTTYIEAPEDGEYTISFNSTGGTGKLKMYETDGETQLGEASTPNENQGTQYYSSIVPTESGMNVSNLTVTLKKGERYKVEIQDALAGISTERDMQLQLAWITPSQAKANLDNAIEAAKTNDTVVVFAYTSVSDPGATIEETSLKLDAAQEKMILDLAKAAHRAGNKVVVVLNNDSAVVMENWINSVDGIFESYYPGQKGGEAIANLLTGVSNPSGRLAFTIPKKDTDTLVTYSEEAFAAYEVAVGEAVVDPMMGFAMSDTQTEYTEGILTGYRWFDSMGVEPEYDFGYGLSYTSFEYSDFEVSEKTEGDEKAGYDVTFTVTNTGDYAGKDVAQIYLGQAEVPDGIQSALYQLAGYHKTGVIKPGESEKVTIHVSGRSLSYWNSNQTELNENADGTKDKWTVATGERELVVARSESEKDFVFTTTIDVK